MNSVQKDYLLKLFEHPKYHEIGRQWCSKVVITKERREINTFWSKATPILNTKGPTKTAAEWKKSYWDMARYAIDKARTGSTMIVPPEGSEDLPYDYTTHNPDFDRIMKIVGWEVAFSNENLDGNKENSMDDPLDNVHQMQQRQRSKSPLSAWQLPASVSAPSPSPPLFTGSVYNHNKRSLSPLSRASSPAAGASSSNSKKRSLSPLSCASSPASVSSINATLSELASAVDKISQALVKNTEMLKELKDAFDSAAVTVLDQNQIVNYEAVTQDVNRNVMELEQMVSDETAESDAAGNIIFMGTEATGDDIANELEEFLKRN